MDARKEVYAGLFLLTLATMMFELLLTRIFSVTLWYHFAFMAVSLAMFGMTAGAGFVNIQPRWFPPERTREMLALFSVLFSVGAVVSFWAQVTIPVTLQFSSGLTIAATFLVLAIPFFFSGVAVCLALTRFPNQVGSLYAADLAGAAIGCLAIIGLLELVDAPTAVVWVGAIVAGAALLFAPDKSKLRAVALACCLLLTGLALANPTTRFVKLTWSKGDESVKPLFEKWNSFSRIRVYGNPDTLDKPTGWGLSSQMPADLQVKQLNLDIDSFAGTVLTAFDGNLDQVRHLGYDITNSVHHLRSNADVLVIGVGGGRDVLSALLFKQHSVLGVEINRDIIKAVAQKFGDFTGHIDKMPQVTLVNDEARSYLTGTNKKFDIIQMSLVDTFAASSAGAFALTENTLYTEEAWKLFLSRLTDRGVLSVTRWYSKRRPAEVYRAVSLAVAAMRDVGITDYRNHLILVKVVPQKLAAQPEETGLGTLLVSKAPLTAADLSALEKVCQEMHFQIALSPTTVADPVLAKLTAGDPRELAQFLNSYPIRIDAPSDDAPFFFQMIKLGDWQTLDALDQDRMISAYTTALFNVAILAILIGGLNLIFFVAPFMLSTIRPKVIKALPLSIYFSAIGFGFIVVEIALVQRFQLVLGMPIYSLAVTLFTLLLASSAGSFLAGKVEQKYPDRAHWLLIGLLVILLIFGVTHRSILDYCIAMPIMVRILISAAMMGVLGLGMGCCFPLGMRLAFRSVPESTPWLWGCNGAMSVSGSIAALLIALATSISISYWTGVVAYVVAIITYFAYSMTLNKKSAATEP